MVETYEVHDAARGSNFVAVGEFNQAVVADAIRRANQTISRVELAAATGLSVQTISNVTRRLMESGLIEEVGYLNVGPGKPRTLLSMVADRYFAVGIHFDPSSATAVLLDLMGVVQHRIVQPLSSGGSPEALIDRIAALTKNLVDEAAVDESRILGVGVAVPGPLNVRKGIVESGGVLDPLDYRGWENLPLLDALSAVLDFPILIERDIAAAVVGELWSSRQGAVDDFIFFYYGTGVNVGIALGRDVVRGASGRAGNARHSYTGPGGPPCRCGRNGCLEESCRPDAVVRHAAAEESLIPEWLDGASLRERMVHLVALASEGDVAATALFAEIGRRIGTALATTILMVDAPRVVAGGPFWDIASSVLRGSILEALRSDPVLERAGEIELVDAVAGHDVVAVGAACLVLDRSFGARPSSMVLSA